MPKFPSHFALLVSLLVCGCGSSYSRPDRVPANGKITLDGQPLAGAQIGFRPAAPDSKYKRPSRAVSDAEGNFSIGTYGAEDGLPPGEYKVSVVKKEPVGELPEDFNLEDPAASSKPVKFQWIVPKKYADANESGITVEMTPDGLSPATIAIETGGQKPEIEVIGGPSSRPSDP